MSFWKNIFGKSNTKIDSESVLPIEFRQWTKLAMELIGKESNGMEIDELHDFLISKGIPEFEASELIIFLPTAFCRKLLPKINWLPSYNDYYSEKKNIKRIYQENKRYQIIEEETDNYWSGSPDNNYVLNITGRSSEFDAINQLLNDGGKMEDIILTEVSVIRYD